MYTIFPFFSFPPDLSDSALTSQLCPRCACKFERRNTGVIRVVVVLVAGVIAALSLYMAFLLCLDPLMVRGARGAANGNTVQADYVEQSNEVSEGQEGILPSVRSSHFLLCKMRKEVR